MTMMVHILSIVITLGLAYNLDVLHLYGQEGAVCCILIVNFIGIFYHMEKAVQS